MQIINKLTALGLTNEQAQIYVLLVQQGELRINEIVKHTGIARSSVYENLKKLSDWELAEEIVEDGYKRIRPYPIAALKRSFSEQILDLKEKAEGLDLLEQALEKQIGQTKTGVSKIRYYQGRSGARQIFWNTLKAKNMLYVYSEWGRGRYLGINFYKKFVEESYARNIKEKVITNPTSQTLHSIRDHANTPVSRTKLSTIRTIPVEQIKLKGDSLMYDNTFAQVYLKDGEIHGFEIENSDFVKFQRQLFEQQWQNATPVAQYLRSLDLGE